jgi:hypothetical protein
MQYVVHFPKGEKYVSLLRNAEDSQAQKVLEAERARIRAKVQQQLADEAIITRADEGRLQSLQQPANEQAALRAQQVKNFLLTMISWCAHADSENPEHTSTNRMVSCQAVAFFGYTGQADVHCVPPHDF